MKKVKIMIVEDSKTQSQSLRLILENEKYDVVSAEDSGGAMALLKKSPLPALILMDIVLKGLDGIALTKMIKKEYPDIFIIVVTAYPQNLKESFNAGAIDFISKPLNKIELMSRINNALRIKNAENSLKMALQNLKRKKDKLKLVAMHDALTGVYSRFAFNDIMDSVLSVSKRHNRKFALLVLDVDNFKWINDNYGHYTGDKVLVTVAKILKKCIRKEDSVFRLGGDEFAMIFQDIKYTSDIMVVAEKVLSAFNTSFPFASKNIHVTVSIGIADNITSKGDDNLQVQADMALYKAKQNGKNCYEFFDDNIKKEFSRVHMMEAELFNAIEKNEFELNYQPVVYIPDNKIVGVEALLRWNNKIFGKVSPAEFIPIAEKSRKIHQIGFWVLDNVCRQIAEWVKLGVKDKFVSVNVSAIQFENKKFKNDIASLLRKYSINPAILEIELTESALNPMLKNIKEDFCIFLKQIHIKISIDDFGKRGTQLFDMKTFPISTVKIDGAFINAINKNAMNNTIVKNIINFAKSLNLNTIGECVETKEQADFLLENGCYLAQGFYYYRPMPADELTPILKKVVNN